MQQVCFRNPGYCEGDIFWRENAAREVLALPTQQALFNEDIEYVCRNVAGFCSQASTPSGLSVPAAIEMSNVL